MKFISILTLLLLNFSVFGVFPVQGLPSETPETVKRKFNSNSFFKGLKLYQGYFPNNPSVCCARGMGIYSLMNGKFLETFYYTDSDNIKGSGIYKDYNFSYDFSVNLDRDIVYEESLSLDLNSQSPKYENKKYDYRKDLKITEVMNEVWGELLVTDFKNARFTDVITSTERRRQIYQGKEFTYEIIYNKVLSNSLVKHPIIRIRVIIPEYIETTRILEEFEERL
jgi:hypothetical protein